MLRFRYPGPAAMVLLLVAACGGPLQVAEQSAVVPLAPAGGVASTPVSDAGVTPYVIPGANPGGNRTCTEVGSAFGTTFAYASARVNHEGGGFDAAFPAGLTVTTDGTTVSFSSTFAIGAVIVKGGNAANVYVYDPAALEDSGLAAPVNASGGPAGLSNITFCWNAEPPREDDPLEVTKDAHTEWVCAYDWGITKWNHGPWPVVLDLGDSHAVRYGVKVWLKDCEFVSASVSGTISVHNPNAAAAASISSVTDVLTGSIEADVDCGVQFPHTLAAGATLTCSYTAELPDLEPRLNTATVTTDGGVGGGTGTANVTFSATADATVNECVDVYDDKGGAAYELLGTVCLGDLEPQPLFGGTVQGVLFEYELTFGPYGEAKCDAVWHVVNTAKVVFEDDTFRSVTDTVKIKVVCPAGGSEEVRYDLI